MVDESLPERLDVCLQCPESLGCDAKMTCLALDGQGRLMATGCGDGRNIVWDLETRGVRVVLEDDRWRGCGPVESVLLSEDGMFVLSCHSLKSEQDEYRKVFVLWMLGLSSEASVVATHEILCKKSEAGAVLMHRGCDHMDDHGVVMSAMMILGEAPMKLNVYERGNRPIANDSRLGMYPAVGIGSNAENDRTTSYHIEANPLQVPVGKRDIPKESTKKANVNKKKKNKQESVSSGGTTVTDTSVKDEGGDCTSKENDMSIIGRKVDVYWDGENEWYRGTVKHRDDTRMFIVYEDGDQEWVLFHGDVPWKYVDSDVPIVRIHMAYCPSTDVIAICDARRMKLTLHKGCDFSVTHVHHLGYGHIAPSNMTFSRDGSNLSLTYTNGLIELVQIGDTIRVGKKLNFMETSAGRRKMRQHTWCCSAFSPGGNYLFSSMTLDREQNKHGILTWDHGKNIAKNLLQGQCSKILAMVCHPVPTPMQIIVLSDDGRVYIWSSIMHQNWSVFQPDFETLDKNREYIEVETEFDLPPLHNALPLATGDGKLRVLHDEPSDEEILID